MKRKEIGKQAENHHHTPPLKKIAQKGKEIKTREKN